MTGQSVRIKVSNQLDLEGEYRGQEGKGAALVLHPHPLYGGSMHNNVVYALMSAAGQAGLSTLRFNFRGVGSSGGSFGGGKAEREDVLAAASWLGGRASGPLALLGYSFGAIVGSLAASELAPAAGVWVSPPLALLPLEDWPPGAGPLLLAYAESDQFAAPDQIEAWAMRQGAPVELKRFEGTDHFWLGMESELKAIINGFLSKLQQEDK